jgi:geranylgeranyl diphosphate synthase type I
MDFQNRSEVSVGEYVTMVSGKTAALIEASTAIGAMVATDDPRIINRFRTFGREIGIAFQIRDDILGIWGDPANTGKSARNDIRNKKKSLPVLYAMEKSKDRDELKRIYAKEQLSEGDITRVFDILTEAGALEYTQREAQRYKDDAMAQFDGVKLHKAPMDKLRDIGLFLVERDY